MCNPYNTSAVLFALFDGDYITAISLLSRIPCNHKRYAYVYHRLTQCMLKDCQTIGSFNDDIYRAYLLLDTPYEFTYKHTRKLKGGVIK